MNISNIVNKVKSGIYRDFILSLMASAVTTIVAQLITNPFLARMCSSEEYGMILTIMGIGNVVTLAFGNSLNNVRLIMNNDYEEHNEDGDFKPLFILLSVIGTMVFGGYLIWFGEKSIILIVSLCSFALFGILQNYGGVAFRIKINYIKNLLLNISIAGGNMVGLLVLYFTGNRSLWALTFAVGQIVGVVYIYQNSSIFKESFRFTSLIMKTLKKEGVLLFTTLCANILVYLDRLILYPLLGGDAVSIYTVASFFGKSLAILMNPISGVLLSYYAQRSYGMNIRRFWKVNILTLGLSAAFIIFSLFASEWVTGLFYPSLIGQAKPYLLIANLAAVINVIGNLAQPAILKFASTKWIAINQIFYMVMYLGIGVVLSRTNGLMGFSQAALASSTVRAFIFFGVGHVAIRRRGGD